MFLYLYQFFESWYKSQQIVSIVSYLHLCTQYLSTLIRFFFCWLHSLLQLLCILSFGRSHWGRPLAHSFSLPGDLTIRIYCKSLFFINVYVISPPPSQTLSQSGQRGLVLCLAATALFGLNPFHSTMFSYWLAGAV